MINATLTRFSSYVSLSIYVLWQEETLSSRKRCGVFKCKSAFEDREPFFQMSGANA